MCDALYGICKIPSDAMLIVFVNRERMLRLGVEQDNGRPLNSQVIIFFFFQLPNETVLRQFSFFLPLDNIQTATCAV